MAEFTIYPHVRQLIADTSTTLTAAPPTTQLLTLSWSAAGVRIQRVGVVTIALTLVTKVFVSKVWSVKTLTFSTNKMT